LPIINVTMLEGRTTEQKRTLAKEMTDLVCDVLKCPAEAVTIVIEELPRENIAKAGRLYSDQ
jgi:4-oxalocrotonate tautomerase